METIEEEVVHKLLMPYPRLFTRRARKMFVGMMSVALNEYQDLDEAKELTRRFIDRCAREGAYDSVSVREVANDVIAKAKERIRENKEKIEQNEERIRSNDSSVEEIDRRIEELNEEIDNELRKAME